MKIVIATKLLGVKRDKIKTQIIEGNPVLVVIDIQGGPAPEGKVEIIPCMPGYQQNMDRAPALIEKAREC